MGIGMKRVGLLVLGTVFLTASSGFADGGLSDGGGNSVVCFDTPEIPKSIRASGGEILNEHIAHITFIEAFDLYEAKLKRGFGG